MARLIGPSEASREVKTIVTSAGATRGLFKSKALRPATYYTSSAATALADVINLDGSPIVDSTVTIDAYSMLPLMQFPDGIDVVYIRVDGGPAWPVYAREDDRLDALGAAVTALQGGVAGAETPAGAQNKVDAHSADTTAVHGIADTSALETQTGAQTKATAAQSAAIAAAATDATSKASAAQAAAISAAASNGKSADTITDGTTNKAFLATERTKLTGVATAATANSTDAQLRDRSTHTGSQATSTVTGLDAALAAKVGRPESAWDVRWSGVIGDGTTDDTVALLAAKTVCSGANKPTMHIAPELNVRLNSQVDLTGVRRIDAQGTITIGYTGGAGLIVGDTSTQRQSLNYYFSRVVWAGAQTNVALRFVGMKNGHVEVQHCDYMQLYADSANTSQTSLAYTDFFIGRILKLELFGEVGVSWINENNFYGGSIDTLVLGGGYPHNGNRWHKTSMEGAASTLQFLVGSDNRVELRGEAFPVVTFGTGTWGNEVYAHYASAPGVHTPAMIVASDGGTENVFSSVIDTNMTYREIVKIDARAIGFDASSEINCPDASVPVPGFDQLALRTAFGIVLDTGIVPINTFFAIDGSTNYLRNYGLVRLNFDSDVTLWRPTIYAYDSAGAAIDPTVTPWMATTGGWTANAGGYYTFGANVQIAQMTITSTAVASIRITVLPSSTAGTAFRYVRLMGYVKRPQPDTAIEALRQRVRRPLYQSAAPTQGIARVGTQINGSGVVYTCATRTDTTLSTPAVATDTTITVASATGIASGDVIGILLDTGKTHWTTVNGAPAGSVVTLTVAMPASAAAGKTVAANRWDTTRTLASDIQTFTASGTWTKPNGAKTVEVVLIGGGGGGGSGRKGLDGTARCGGGSGAGAALVHITLPAAAVTAMVAVTVGAGGAGGAAQATNSTNGNQGISGTDTLFGGYLKGIHGNGGGGGGSAVGGTAGVSWPGTAPGGLGIAASASGGVGTAPPLNAGAPGGCSGGGITTANVANVGGFRNSVGGSWGVVADGSASVVDGATPTSGDSAPAGVPIVGGVAAGGAASITTNAQAGAAGALYGAGGGGGGAAKDAVGDSGAGGAGAAGIAQIISYF